MDLLLMELLYNVEWFGQVIGTGFWWIHELCCYAPVDNSWFDPEPVLDPNLDLEGLF